MAGTLVHTILDTLPQESIIEFLAVVMAVCTIVILWRYRKSPEVKYMLFIEFFAAIWAFTYGMEFSSPDLETKKHWSQLSYLGISFLPVCYFLFTTAFSQKYHVITPLNIGLLSIIPFFTLLLIFTNDYHLLVWSKVWLANGANMLLYKHGIWFWVFWGYSITLIFAGLYNLLHAMHEFTAYYKSQANTLLVATLFPFLGNVMYVTGINPIPGLDWTPLFFVFPGLIITFGVVRYRMFDLVPFARNKLIDTMSDGVIVINSEGFIEDCNPALYRIFSLNGKSIIRKHFSRIFARYQDLVASLEGEKIKVIELEVYNTGLLRFYQTQISPVFNRNQQFSGYLVQLNDITSLKQTQNRIKETNEQLQNEVEERGRLIEDLDAFAHAVAHDLRNSLGSVYASSEVMQLSAEDGDTEQLKEMAGLVREAAQKAMNITQELLILATVSHQEIEGTPLEMARIFSDAKNQLKNLISKSNAQIHTPDTWPVAMGYAPWIEEVWANYLTNAMKYGGTPPVIEVGADTLQNGVVRFWIQDNGNGISLENQHKLFQKYIRLAPEKAEGYGLGLSIVKRIVEKLDGRVGVESTGREGEGARFWFELPESPAKS
ncbi:PAS domain S-box protein [Mariniphaga sediminis]|uniref:histidine kinase n=1 Tax=Mariniphaga sediminis TaxID=1628158 RepID=A0A399CUZ8_9BACT|nr:histidine kinase N-terminal 7TM domain-containing protein [Mariniphaga sediminis]RIH63086.1 PAS domain S-box protein [Mariniphaga sediminis]